MLYIKRLLLALAAAFLISGCSSSGGGASPATITAENAKDLAVAGTEAAKAASDSDDLAFFKSGSSSSMAPINIAKVVMQNLHAQDDLSSWFCSNPDGSAIFEYPDDPNATTGTVSFTFTNCVYVDTYETVTINGSIIIRVSTTSATITGNLSFTENGITENFTFSGTCSVSNSNIGSCSYSSTFTGSDGRTYSMANISVSGNDFTGYTVSGSVTDPDHGVITISTPQPITFNCASGYPDSGQIVIEGSNGSATVTYNSCTSFTVTFEGVGTSYNWADI